MATNDDANGTLQSQVTFTASSGTPYRIAVDQFQRVSDTDSAYNLAWIQPQAPVITSQPRSTNVFAGNPVTFSVSAVGVPTPTYQWRKNGGNISGATSSSYTISNVQASHAGDYTVVVTNSAGSVTSATATLGVYDAATATLGTVTVTGSGIEFDVTGVPTYTYVVQASTNLTSWVPVYTNTSPFTFSYTITTNYPARFFRAVY